MVLSDPALIWVFPETAHGALSDGDDARDPELLKNLQAVMEYYVVFCKRRAIAKETPGARRC